MSIFVNYGCGIDAPRGWLNFDASPTLRLRKIFILRLFFRKNLNVHFPHNVNYANIVKGLPLMNNSCDAVFCSHILEHLSLEDFRIALRNTYSILKYGGTFRLVMPDLLYAVNEYIKNKNSDPSASIEFLTRTNLGYVTRPGNLKQFIISYLGNSRHLWLWDIESTTRELEIAGFIDIRRCYFNDSAIAEFRTVENESRFRNAIALEMKK